MKYWIGTRAAIDAANETAFATYIADNPIAQRAHEVVPNPTTLWAVPEQDAKGNWVIPAYPGVSAPAGCTAVDDIDWPKLTEAE